MDDDWEQDLLDLAEAPAPKKKRKEKKKRKRESSGSNSDMEIAGSGSDMDLQGDSDEDGSPQADEVEGELRPDMFPVDGIYKSTAERAELMERNEMEREMILEERREKLQAYQDRQALRQLVADQEGHGPDSDSDARPTRRRAPQSKRAKQLEELKQKRKSKSEREEKRAKKRAAGSDYDDSDEENKQRRSPSVPVYTDSEDEEDAEYEKDDDKLSAKKKGKSREPASQGDLLRICLPRAKLAQYWPCPWFSEYVEGAYVRMGVGQENGQPIYRLAKIEKVAEAKASKLYKLERNVTDIKLTLIIGDDKKDMTMEMVSNSPPNEREFNRYIATLKSKNLELPSKSEVEAKVESLQKYKDAVLTEHDISLILAKKKEYAKGNIHDRHTLRNERDIAIRSGNVEEVAQLDRILADLDGKNSQLASNGQSTTLQQNKAPLTLEERRRNLAMASMAVGTPKAVAGKTASPAISKPASGANTPQRQIAASSANASQESNKTGSQTSQTGEQHKQNKFQRLLASKVDIDLGDF